MFETKGKMDEAFFKDAYFATFQRWKIVIVVICLAVYVFFAVYNLSNGIAYIVEYGYMFVSYFIYAFIFLVLALLFPLLFFLIIPKRFAKINAGRIVETYGTGDVEFTITLEDEGVRTTNSVNENATLIRYDDIKRLSVGKKAIFLITNARFFCPVFTDGLSADEKAALADRLKAKITKR